MLSPQEQATYLRRSALIPVTPELAAEAAELTRGAETPLEKVRLLFHHLATQYRYLYPPPERGALAMRRNRAGDCGEFAFLLAAWCRSLGIPCRVLMGAWAHGAGNGHAWAEAFIPGQGWIPADPSLAATRWWRWWQRRRGFQPGRLEPYFGQLEGRRLVFSLDVDRALVPAYEPGSPPSGFPRRRMGGVSLAWGHELLEGNAPYLQPAYVRFSHPGGPRQERDLLGEWVVLEPLPRRLGGWLQFIALVVGAGANLLGHLPALRAQPEPSGVPLDWLAYWGFLVWSSLAAWRGQSRWLTLPMAVLLLAYGLANLLTA